MKIINYIYGILIATILSMVAFGVVHSQELINAKNGAVIKINNQAVIKINGGLNLGTGSTFSSAANITLTGNWINAGNQTISAGKVTFIGNSNSDINCTGSSNQFLLIEINKDSLIYQVNQLSGLDVPAAGFLKFLKGTYNISGTFVFSNPVIITETGFQSIPAQCLFVVDNSNAVISGALASVNIFGGIDLRKGKMNVGDGTDFRYLKYNNGASILLGNDISAQLNLSGSLFPENATDSIYWNQSGGIVNIGNSFSSSLTDKAMFDIPAANSIFKMSGGSIVLKRASSTSDDYRVHSILDTVSGGELVIHVANAGEVFTINSKSDLFTYKQLATNNPLVTLTENLQVLDDAMISGTVGNALSFNGYELRIGGDLFDSVSVSGLNQGTSDIVFNGNNVQNIYSATSINLNNVRVSKTNGNVNLNAPMNISGKFKLVSNTLIDMKSHNVTLKSGADIYTDSLATINSLASFSATKCFVNSGSGVDPLLGSRMIREFSNSPTLPLTLNYPVGTPNVYTPAVVTINNASFVGTPFVSIKPVPREHPAVEDTSRSLQKYWVVDKSGVTLNAQGADLKFYYSLSEVKGAEGSYRVLYFSPSWNNPAGFWQSEPGISDDVVDFNLKLFYSQGVSEINGDWTAGEPEVARAVYYSRADGDYNNPNTWSKIGFGGSVSNTAPNKQSDIVKIQNNSVSITSATAPVSVLSVETGTEGRAAGLLSVEHGYYVQGDTFKLEDNAKLIIKDSLGISIAPISQGNIRTNNRVYSSKAIYTYSGDHTQITGNGLPSGPGALIVDKSNNSEVALSKNISITDSLIINNGKLDLDAYSANGASSGRKLTMRGGELIVRTTFPTNYITPSFTAGTINFAGEGNQSIPSSSSIPAVAQYFNLKLSSTARVGNITLRDLGEIKISNLFDMSELSFVNNTWGFLTAGSTVRFNKNGGAQEVPFKPLAPTDIVCYLNYHNLILDSAGTKTITAVAGNSLRVINNLNITNSADFVSNGFNIELNGNWVNSGGYFHAQNNTVIMNSPVASVSTFITSGSTTNNPFANLQISGSGLVKPLDNIKIDNNLNISSGSELRLDTIKMEIRGNWFNNGGTFTSGTSVVNFYGTVAQTLSKTAGTENFYKLNLDNSLGLNINTAGANSEGGIIVNDSLNLLHGNISGRNRQVTALGVITRTGGGFIDAELRKNVAAGALVKQFEVGYDKAYTPVSLEFTGTAGATGLLAVKSDTVTTATSPIKWDNDPPTDVLPAGSTISVSRHITRQWTVSIPTASTFVLGPTRKYNAVYNFRKGTAPSGDIRNSALYNQFEARMYSGSSWIAPYAFTTFPSMGSLTDSSSQFKDLDRFGTVILGEPGLLSFYTRGDGNWTNPANWSNLGYDGPQAAVYPGMTNYTRSRVFIGKGHTITLDTNNIQLANNALDSALVKVDSTGYLKCDANIIGGAGKFLLSSGGKLGVGSANGITQSTASGNIQLASRDYNYLNNNNTTIEYTGNLAQTQANEAVPLNLSAIIVNKSGNTLTFNRVNPTIKDSLSILSGTFNAGSNITLTGNMRLAAGASFTPGTNTVFLTGSTADTIFNNSASLLNFYNLTIQKPANTNNVLLGTNSPISVSNRLTFDSTSAGYKSLLDATSLPGSYVQLGTSAQVLGASQAAGWLFGELRHNVPSGDAPLILFRIGDLNRYSPYSLDFRDSTMSGTTGYVAMRVIEGVHPYLYADANSPIAVSRMIGPKYWRLTKPAGSTFSRGNRRVHLRAYFASPGDDRLVDYWGCVEMAYMRSSSGATPDWQGLYAASTQANDGTFSCNDTRVTTKTPSFTYSGATANQLAYANVASVWTSFGSTDLVGSDSLLAEFVLGNRNEIKFFNFYSIKDGDWSDPGTWSTVSFNSTVNQAVNYPLDPLVRGIPRRQYDNVIIGNGKKVTLDVNIGHNVLNGGAYVYTLAGPSVIVQSGATLALGNHTLRGMAFTAEKGSTLEVGAANGLTTSGNNSNIILITGNPTPKYFDSLNVVYTAEGFTLGGTNSLAQPQRTSNTYYIERVQILDASDNIIMDNITMDTLIATGTRGTNNYYHKKAVLTAGQSYSLNIDPSVSGNKRYKVWIDYNRDGDFADANEEVLNITNSSGSLFNTGTFTVLTGAVASSTLMRVGMRQNTNNSLDPGTSGTGEFEDYTVDIINPTTTITQATGNGLPSIVSSLQVRSPRAGSTVNLGKNVVVLDSVRCTAGVLDAGTNTIDLYGSFIHDTLNGFNASSSTVNLLGANTSDIRGKDTVTFSTLNFRKNKASVNIANNVYINSALNYDSTFVSTLGDDKLLTFNTGGSLNVTNAAYSKNKMFKVNASANPGTIKKIFSTATGNKAFTFPLGVDTLYNPVYFSKYYGAAQAANNILSVQLFAGKHPNRFTETILKKYWRVNALNITNMDSIKFQYDMADTIGKLSRYIPSLYTAANIWEVNLGKAPKAKSASVINPDTIVARNTNNFNGDWTAGEAQVFYGGRTYYSIATGSWNNPDNWSNLSHSGIASSYYPGQVFADDTVYIDGHTITFNLDSISVDSVNVGGTNGNGAQGLLRLANSPLVKKLRVGSLSLGIDNGKIEPESTIANRYDTLFIERRLINNSTGGVDFSGGSNYSTTLKFLNGVDSYISGNGVWTGLSKVVLDKTDGLNDSLFVQSNTFAAATNIAPQMELTINKGVLVNQSTGILDLNNGSLISTMGAFSGLKSEAGTIRSKTQLTSNSSTTYVCNGGNIQIGDGLNEHFLYKTGTLIDVLNGSLFVAGALQRAESNSSLKLNMYPTSTLKVLTSGTNESTAIGFDMTNSSSELNMTGGRIIIANGSGTTPSSADVRINAQLGIGMTGGALQVGDSTITQDLATIKIDGDMPIYDLHLASAPSRRISSKMVSGDFTVKNNWMIDNDHSSDLNGNTVSLGGNFTNYGIFKAYPTVATTNPWQIVLEGTTDQTLFQEDSAAIRLYNLRIAKPSGNITLANNASSNLAVHSTLEFATGNNALIMMPDNNYVELSPVAGSTNQILRNGLGHIAGRLKRYIPSGVQVVDYPVGADSVYSYRPVRIETFDATNTAGLLSVKAYNINHPDSTNSGLRLDNNIERYWNIHSDGFALGSGKSYNIATFFLRTDLINLPNPLFFEHRIHSPEWNNGGTWYSLTPIIKADTMLKSINVTRLGDVTIGEPSGITFYSIADGNWNDINTWSLSGYETPDLPSRVPNTNTDIVRIGNDRTVKVPNLFNPFVRSVYVEKYNSKPGTLLIEGDNTIIRGTSFVLDNDCTLGIQHLNGIMPSSEGLRGAIQTETRTFGVSRYLYNSPIGSQNSGLGLPTTVKSLIVDNPTSVNNNLFISNTVGALAVTVNDTLLIRQGVLNSGNRNIIINNTIYADSIINDGKFAPLTADVIMAGTNAKYIALHNRSGIRFNNLRLQGGTITASNLGSPDTTQAHVFVQNTLNFEGQSYFVPAGSCNLKITNSNPNSILNFGPDRFVLTSMTSGSLYRNLAAGQNYTYPVGSFESGAYHYTPAEFYAGASGTAGRAAVRVSPGRYGAFPGGHARISSSLAKVYLTRYWSIDSVTAHIPGTWRFNYLESDIIGLESDFNQLGRWRPVKEGAGGNWKIYQPIPTINTTSNYFETTAGLGFAEFEGDWTIGNRHTFRRIFFSRQTGPWTDENSWTYNETHSGSIFGTGAYPDSEGDSVVIGGGIAGLNNHVINLTSNTALIGGVSVGSSAYTGTLDTRSFIVNSNYFSLNDGSRLVIGNALGISALGSNTGAVQSTMSRNYSTRAYYEYNGSANQVTGSGLPVTVAGLIVANSGADLSNNVTIDKNISITDTLRVSSGALDLQGFSAFGDGSTVLRIDSAATISIGASANALLSLNNYSDYSTINKFSNIRFYGTNQDVSIVPALMYNPISSSGLGYGNVIVEGGSTNVTKRILLRGNLFVRATGQLAIDPIDGLIVKGSVFNSGSINNGGVIDIGQ